MAAHVRHAFWVACGSLVLLGIFFAALGAFDPTEAVGLTDRTARARRALARARVGRYVARRASRAVGSRAMNEQEPPRHRSRAPHGRPALDDEHRRPPPGAAPRRRPREAAARHGGAGRSRSAAGWRSCTCSSRRSGRSTSVRPLTASADRARAGARLDDRLRLPAPHPRGTGAARRPRTPRFLT